MSEHDCALLIVRRRMQPCLVREPVCAAEAKLEQDIVHAALLSESSQQYIHLPMLASILPVWIYLAMYSTQEKALTDGVLQRPRPSCAVGRAASRSHQTLP